MAAANGQIESLKKKLEGAVKAKDTMKKAKDEAMKARAEAERAKKQAKQEAYELGVAETETNLKTQVPAVCRLYCS